MAGWAPLPYASTISGSTVLVIGAGNIGREYAKRVKALGAYVIGVKRTPGKLEEFDDAGATAIGCIMLVAAFAMLLVINLLQSWSRRRMAG